MATVGCGLSEEQLLCPICLDVFNQPVSTPCGHNFCRDCIQGYWQSADLSQCPVCKQKFYKMPEFQVNIFISEVASHFKKSSQKRDDDDTSTVDRCLSHKAGASCDVRAGKTGKTLKFCLACLASFCETQNILDTFKKLQPIKPLMNMQDRVCKKHQERLCMFCYTDQTFVCQVCVKKKHSSHHTVPIEDLCRGRRAEIGKLNAEVEERITSRLQEISQINQAVRLSTGNTEREIEESLRVFNKLLFFVKKGQEEVVEEIGAKQRQVESRASGLITQLKQEIDDLRQRHAELEQLSHTDDDFFLLHNFPALSTLPDANDWSDTSMDGMVFVGLLRGAVRKTACQIEERVNAEVRRLSSAELKRAQQFALDVTLDPDTAHPKLVLSEDNKQVHHGDVALSLPDDPERFYPGVSVLGKEGFSSGRFYFEVQVKEKTEWDIGVALESVNRKGGNMLNPDSGYWTLGMRQDQSYWALSRTPLRMPLVEKPQRVGVYVDLELGQVSFYSVDTASHIYSFTGYSFNERLFPYFNPRRNHCGLNAAPLIISPV